MTEPQTYADLGETACSVRLVWTAPRTRSSGSPRSAEPLLPPGVGWMQGTAGIAAYLMRLARVLREGRGAPAVARLDTWWNVPGAGPA